MHTMKWSTNDVIQLFHCAHAQCWTYTY